MKNMMTEKKANEIQATRKGTKLAEYATYNPVLRQCCLSTMRLAMRLRCTEDATLTANIGRENHWIEYGWVDGSHPSMSQCWDTEAEATADAVAFARSHDTDAVYVNPAPMTQRGLVKR